MIAAIVLLVLLLIFICCVKPRKSDLSDFELHRRIDTGDSRVANDVLRNDLYDDVLTLRHFLLALLLVSLAATLIAQFGWWWGLLAATLTALVYPRIAGFKLFEAFSQRLYDRNEHKILQVIDRLQPFIKPFRGVFDNYTEREIQSREELEHMITSAPSGLLSIDERKMLSAMFRFEDKLVKDYMTPRSVMNAIGAHELLGPVVLDDLHKTGHSHFPVLDGDIDHIVGILHIHTLFNLRDKESKMVKDIMEPRVLYIHEDQTLDHALAACIKHRRHLLIVINSYRETTGVITIEDAVEQIVGRKIVDEFDQHDDLRAVAERNPRKNNTPPKSSDI